MARVGIKGGGSQYASKSSSGSGGGKRKSQPEFDPEVCKKCDARCTIQIVAKGENEGVGYYKCTNKSCNNFNRWEDPEYQPPSKGGGGSSQSSAKKGKPDGPTMEQHEDLKEGLADLRMRMRRVENIIEQASGAVEEVSASQPEL